MSETFPVTLAGRTWQLPHLPFRILKKLQPRLLAKGAALFGGDLKTLVFRLDEEQLDALAEDAFTALNFAEPTLSKEQFLELPFSSSELLQTVPSLMQACGLELKKAEGQPIEAEDAEKKA
jgi:hypothetical protein